MASTLITAMASSENYFEAWKRGTAPAPRALTAKEKKAQEEAALAKEPRLNVRLDQPGGASYAPDILGPHNSQRRLFVPFSDDGSGRQMYDFRRDIDERSQASGSGSAALPDVATLAVEDAAPSAAQQYASSIDLAPQPPSLAQQFAPLRAPAPLLMPGLREDDGASVNTSATKTSIQTNATARQLAAGMTSTGLAPRVVQRNMAIAPTVIPASRTGGSGSTTRTSNRKLDAPTEAELQRGTTEFEERSGAGRAPALVKSDAGAPRRPGVADEFVADPRPWRPLRLVRRIDPTQMLVLCAGLELSTADAASLSAARARADGFGQDEDTQALLTSFADAEGSDVRCGLGAFFVPAPPAGEDDKRVELNLSRRLERAAHEQTSSGIRAALRAVIAGLEYCRWEEEGYQGIVVGTSEHWIVSGITNDIWLWRKNGWMLTTEGPQGPPGNLVPNRDLWELLDFVVRGYEKIDCSVRFWLLPRSETRPAKELAQEGALKSNQQPGLVKWRKKKIERGT